MGLHLRLIRLIGVMVPQRLRTDWRQEWVAELRYREQLLDRWELLNRRTKLDLFWRSLGAFRDALWLQSYRWEDDVIQDLRFGLRMLLKHRGFTLVAVVSLALGTGANTAIFSLINTVLLRPLPVLSPERIVSLNNTSRHAVFPSLSYPNYRDLRDRNEVFSGLIGYRFTPLSLSHDGINERLWGYEVTGNYFDVLGVRPALGRLISPDDDQMQGAHPVTVLSHKCWQQRFGGELGVIGKDVRVNGRSYTVIGVAPQGFYGTEVIASPELWFPMAMQAALENDDESWLKKRQAETIFVQGRLKSGVTFARAQAEMNSLAAQLEREYPEVNENKGIKLSPPGLIGLALRGPVLGFAGLLMAVVGLVLLLACTNLANLLLARAADRRREIAVRLAMGATRLRLIRQLLTESLLLSVAGGALGLFIAMWLARAASAIKIPVNVPLAFEIQVDHRVFIFTCVLSFVTGALFGLLPALQSAKTDLVPALKDEFSGAGYRGSWWKSGLIILQVALSLVLLVGGGLMLRALGEAQTVHLGFDPMNAVEVGFDLQLQGYDNDRGRAFQKLLLERVRALPDVKSAALADMIPVDLHFSRAPVFVEGQLPERETSAPVALLSRVTPGYLESMGTRLVRGRDFTEQDDEKAVRVAIVNEAFARRFWPGEDPIGKRFSVRGPESPKLQVIGVAEDGKYSSLNEDPRPFVYRSIWQSYSGATSVIVRGEDDPQGVIARVRREVLELDPNLPVSASTLVERLDLPLLPVRIAASVLGGFGVVALMLAAIGIYGVMSYDAASRRREIGVRMALGAQRRHVLKLMLGRGVTLTGIGLAIGLSGAMALTRVMTSLLLGIGATDAVTFLSASMALAGVALLACYLPARRAAKVDPMSALRCE